MPLLCVHLGSLHVLPTLCPSPVERQLGLRLGGAALSLYPTLLAERPHLKCWSLQGVTCLQAARVPLWGGSSFSTMEFLLVSWVRIYQHSVTLGELAACCSSSVAGLFGGGGGADYESCFRNKNLLHLLFFLYRRTLVYQTGCIFCAWFRLALEKSRDDIFLDCISAPQNQLLLCRNPDSLLIGTHITSMNICWTGPFW